MASLAAKLVCKRALNWLEFLLGLTPRPCHQPWAYMQHLQGDTHATRHGHHWPVYFGRHCLGVFWKQPSIETAQKSKRSKATLICKFFKMAHSFSGPFLFSVSCSANLRSRFFFSCFKSWNWWMANTKTSANTPNSIQIPNLYSSRMKQWRISTPPKSSRPFS